MADNSINLGEYVLILSAYLKIKECEYMEIMITKSALSTGYWFVNESRCREWEKYCVVDNGSKIILLTQPTKIECERFINFLNTTTNEPPKGYKKGVARYWRNI